MPTNETPASSEEKPLLKPENLVDGFVDLELELLTGEKTRKRLKAPTWRKRREILIEFHRAMDTEVLFKAVLPATGLNWLLDRLTPDSIAKLEDYALALVCGESFQKKMAELGKQMIQEMISSNGSGSKTE